MSEPKPPASDVDDFAAMFAESEARRGGNPHKRRDPKEGDLVKGKIISIGRDSAFVDIGAKSEGVIELVELRDAEGKLTVAIGDELEARVSEIDGKAGGFLLRRALGRGRGAEAAKELQDALDHQIPIEGVVSAVNKGGLEVQVGGVRAFCPMSQIDLRPVAAEDLAALVGKKLSFRVTRFEDGPRPNVVLSRRALLELENAERAAVTREKLQIGAVLRGRVVALKEFGAFVDLGGIEGLIHNSELGYDRGANAQSVLAVGQELEVAVVRMEPDPKTGRERISLSLRALMADPWQDSAGKLREGVEVVGKVARLEAFGAFVELAPGVEGLVHLSELDKGGRHVRHPKDAVQAGQTLRVVVLAVDPERHRISLGLADEPADNAPAAEASESGKPERFGTFADLLKEKKR
jgi:small subunit ribosomal protein S1